MSSKGEMKMSLNEMIWMQSVKKPQDSNELTFSCLRCLSSLSSRYVLLLKTGVEKGFIIFLMATDVPDNWSFAELEVEWSCRIDDEGQDSWVDKREIGEYVIRFISDSSVLL